MQDDLVFKTSPIKRALGWLVFVGATAGVLGVIYGLYIHPENQIPSELASGAVIILFLGALMWAGIAGQRIRWGIEGENIVYHGLFRNMTIPLSEVAGYGQLMFIVAVFPFQHIDFYNRQLTLIGRLPVNHSDWPKAQAWFAERYRYVVNDGSHALPKRRYADTPRS
jgi:hypothetical protein